MSQSPAQQANTRRVAERWNRIEAARVAREAREGRLFAAGVPTAKEDRENRARRKRSLFIEYGRTGGKKTKREHGRALDTDEAVDYLRRATGEV